MQTRKRQDVKEYRETLRKLSAVSGISVVCPNTGDIVLAPGPPPASLEDNPGVSTVVSFSAGDEGPPAYPRHPSLATLDGDDVQEYITLKTGTASLSHEGTSFYLRLGCLCKHGKWHIHSMGKNNAIVLIYY